MDASWFVLFLLDSNMIKFVYVIILNCKSETQQVFAYMHAR